MKQALWWLPAVLLLCAAPVAAQVQFLESEGPKDTPIPITKFTLHPAAAPVPALKYRLLPELRDLKPGNAVVLYYRAFSPEWQGIFKNDKVRKDIEKWHDDLTKPPPAGLKFVLNDHALKEIDLAARRAYCDWDMLERLRQDGINMLLPDIQSFRNYFNLLPARARFEMLDKKFDKAIYTLQTGFAFARHISEGPTLIQALVGGATTNIMVGEVEQFIQQPGAPNLYWALTDLPTPFIDLKKSLQGEKLFIDSLFPGWREQLQDLDARPLSQGELTVFLDKALENLKLLNGLSSGTQFFSTKLGLATLAAKSYPEARKFLLDQGRPKKLVDAMPVVQAVLLYEIHNYDRFNDSITKWYGLPYPQMRKGVAQAIKELYKAKAENTAGTNVATFLLPAVEKVFNVSYRTDRKIALLRCVEALRLHAAANDGKFPASLKDITEVPVPLDPFTGSSFEYQLKENTATLTAPVPPSETYFPGMHWSFALTMQP